MARVGINELIKRCKLIFPLSLANTCQVQLCTLSRASSSVALAQAHGERSAMKVINVWNLAPYYDYRLNFDLNCITDQKRIAVNEMYYHIIFSIAFLLCAPETGFAVSNGKLPVT